MQKLFLIIAVLMTLVIPKSKPEKEDILNWLATVPGYIEGTMEIRGEPIVLDAWQRTGVNVIPKFNAWLKSRQVGFSLKRAAHSLAKAQLNDRYLKVLVSMNLDDAREKIIYARELYETIPDKFKVKLTTDNKMELGFANGSRITTMFMPRGKGPADVDIDEMAFMARSRDIFKAAMFMTLRGGQIVIGSTPMGKAGLFYEIISGAESEDPNAGFKDFRVHRIPWWLSSALCKDVLRASVEAPLMTTHERVYKFGTLSLIQIYENTYLEDFQQECEISFQDEQEAFIPIDLILRCVDPDPEYLYFNKLETVAEDLKTIMEKLRGIPYAGYDVGRRNHPAVLVILELLGDKFFHRMTITMPKKPFEEQKYILSQALEILPIARMGIDETGMGMNLAEDLSKLYPHTVVPINFASRVESDIRNISKKDKKETIAVKERMATDVKIAFERENMAIPQDRDFIRQIHSVKKETSAIGTVQYSVDKNEKHHADKFWALAMAILVARPAKTSVLIPPVFPRIRA